MKSFGILLLSLSLHSSLATAVEHRINFHAAIQISSPQFPKGSAENFRQQFMQLDVNAADDLVVDLNSPGGHTGEAYRIYHFLRWLSDKDVNVITKVGATSDCASACIMLDLPDKI